MDENTNVAPAAPADFTPQLPADAGPMNARDAGRLINEAREKAFKAAQEPEKKLEQPRVNGRFASAAAPQESPLEGADAGPDTPVPGETVQDDPAELPPIEPPRSWSKEDKELFNNLPRETQERVADRERSRESDFLRRQNEATEKSKALEAKEQAAEQARQQYESAAQNALQFLQSQMSAEFADIKSDDDLRKLADTDPFRYLQFDARMKQLQHQQQQLVQLQQQREQETRKTFETWAKEQDSKFEKQFPEFADKTKAAEIGKALTRYLVDEVGVPEGALPQLRNQELFRDAMYQRVVYDAYRFHTAQQKAKAAVAVPKPAPQRPGAASEKGSSAQEAIAAAQQRLNGAKGIEAARAAADLIAAKRKAARR